LRKAFCEFKINPVFPDKERNNGGSKYTVSKLGKMTEVFMILIVKELEKRKFSKILKNEYKLRLYGNNLL